MSLAQLFYLKETFRERIRRWRQACVRRQAQRSAPRAQHFTLESLEPRVLLSASVADAVVVEGNTGSQILNFVVTLSQAATTNVTVAYRTFDGTATSGVDYQAEAGTVTILAGQTSGTITIAALGDTLVEADEFVVVELTNPGNAVLAGGVTALQGVGTIRDNDRLPPLPGLPIVTVQDLVVQEQVGGSTATFTLSIPTPAGLTITGTYAILAGTATAGADYTPSSGTFTILAGATSTTVNVPVLNDNLVEPIETFVLRLTQPQNAQFTNASSALYAITRIVDNPSDVNEAPVLGAIGNRTVQVGQTLTFTVTSGSICHAPPPHPDEASGVGTSGRQCGGGNPSEGGCGGAVVIEGFLIFQDDSLLGVAV